MNRNKLKKFVDDFILWSALLVYGSIWLLISKSLMGNLWLIAGGLPGLMYCLGHIHEIKNRGHCYASADPTAIPLALLGTVMVYFYFLISGKLPAGGTLAFVKLFLFSFGAGHVAALIYSFILSFIFSFFI